MCSIFDLLKLRFEKGSFIYMRGENGTLFRGTSPIPVLHFPIDYSLPKKPLRSIYETLLKFVRQKPDKTLQNLSNRLIEPQQDAAGRRFSIGIFSRFSTPRKEFERRRIGGELGGYTASLAPLHIVLAQRPCLSLVCHYFTQHPPPPIPLFFFFKRALDHHVHRIPEGVRLYTW